MEKTKWEERKTKTQQSRKPPENAEGIQDIKIKQVKKHHRLATYFRTNRGRSRDYYKERPGLDKDTHFIDIKQPERLIENEKDFTLQEILENKQ